MIVGYEIHVFAQQGRIIYQILIQQFVHVQFKILY